MLKLLRVIGVLVVTTVSMVAGGQVSMEAAYSVLVPADEVVEKGALHEGIDGRVVAGYQGWFRAVGDGSQMGFSHYQKGGRFEPGSCSIDLWPDLSEYGEDEKFATAFRHKDGSVAKVFSSLHPKTVDRHFQWMKEYGIDGAFVQRFGVVGGKEWRSYESLRCDNLKLLNCRAAANAHGRCYALMYDLSGLESGDFERLARDWKELRKRMKLGTDPNDRAYLRHRGRPLVAIWGVGFDDDRRYGLDDVERFIRLLKDNPEWGGMSVMLGVPFGWREQNRDAVGDQKLHQVLKMADVISPWSVGRYGEVDFASGKFVANQIEDRKWCEQNQIDYLPVVYPGFSWHNLKGDRLDAISRRGGKFLWDQFVATRAAGSRSAYVAMFDEMDEGTAIFKCTNEPPVGEGVRFLDYGGLASDHYLRLTGRGARLLRGEIPAEN